MPTYVYRRPDGTTFETFQKISDPALTEDPATGVPVTRVISGGAGLQFKGDGFYITDYVRKHDAPDATPGGKKAETSTTDATPEVPTKKAPAKAAKTPATPSGTGGNSSDA